MKVFIFFLIYVGKQIVCFVSRFGIDGQKKKIKCMCICRCAYVHMCICRLKQTDQHVGTGGEELLPDPPGVDLMKPFGPKLTDKT
jgi:hypothetical protein